MPTLYPYQTIKTNNFSDQNIVAKISGLWEDFTKEYDLSEYPVFILYHDYESDYKGDFSVSLCSSRKLDGADMFDLDLEQAVDYPCSSVDQLAAVWQRIWRDEEAGELKRSYRYDVEEYRPDGSIVIHIL